MGNSVAGGLKKAKTFFGDAAKWVGDKVSTIGSAVVDFLPLPDVLENPIKNGVQTIGNTVSQAGQAINGEISGQQFGENLLNDYRHGILAPVNAVKNIVDGVNNAKANGGSVGDGISQGLSNLASDTANYYNNLFQD